MEEVENVLPAEVRAPGDPQLHDHVEHGENLQSGWNASRLSQDRLATDWETCLGRTGVAQLSQWSDSGSPRSHRRRRAHAALFDGHGPI